MKKKILALLVATALMLLSVGGGVLFTACGPAAALDSIRVTTKPTKTAYTVGDTFDPAGMVVTAYFADETEKALKGTEYTYAPSGKLTAADTKITITYTVGEVTKETTQSVTVANPVTSATIKTPAARLEYYIGEKFDPAGMIITATYKDGSSKDLVVAESSAVTYKTDALASTDTTLTFTVGDKTVTQTITLLKGIYIEAEDGIINSEKHVINEDSPEASGGKYVGNMFAGDSVLYKFVADKAGKADIAFRLASLYLKEDNNWTPILMGDCQFNKIVKFSVNGVNYEIPDSVVLPGGGTAGGEPDPSLWFNWKEVVFEDVDLVKDTNVVKMEFIPHDYTDTSQSSYSGKFTANVDSLKVTTTDITIGEQPYEYAVTDAYIRKTAGETAEADVAEYVVEGTVAGYEKDSFRLSFTEVGTEVVTNVPLIMEIAADGKFAAVADMSALTTNKVYTATFGVKDEEELTPLAYGGADEAPFVVGRRTYSVVVPEGMDAKTTAVKIESDETYSIASAKLELADGKPYYVLEGSVVGYAKDDFVFDFQENNAWGYASDITFAMAIDEAAETFKVSVDMSKLPKSGNTWIPHFKLKTETQQGAGDLSAENIAFTADQTVAAGIFTYAISTDAFNCIGVRKSAKEGVALTGTDASLEVAGEKVYYVLTGTYAGITKDELAAVPVADLGFDLQQNQQAGGSGWDAFKCEGTMTVTDAGFVIKYDVTALDVNPYTTHFFYGDLKLATSFDGTAEGKSASAGGKNYELVSVAGSSEGSEFWGCVGLKITAAA